MRRWGVLALAGGLAGCGLVGAQPVACTAESASAPVVDIVRDQLEKRLSGQLKDANGGRMVSLANIRAAIAQLTIGLDDIRTSREDPNSTKRFCAATLSVKFASDTLTDANKGREALQLGSISDLADGQDIERQADRFSTPIEFEIQPTDDGAKVFAETASDNTMFGFAADVLGAGLMRARVEGAQRDQLRSEVEQAAQQDAALSEQRNANLASVRLDNQLAVQTVGALWKGLPDGTRKQLLPMQRAWIRKKDADCRVEAAQSSTDPAEMEAARVQCDTRVTQERIGWLQRLPVEPDHEPSVTDRDTMMANDAM